MQRRGAGPATVLPRIESDREPGRRPWLAVVLLVGLAGGCAAPVDESWHAAPRYPYRTVPPPETPPPLIHCNDRTGHIAGTLPWIHGGTCTCNPSTEVLADYKAQGWFEGWSVDTLEATYRTLGVATLRDHRDCNNLCVYGPHVRKGGRCLVPPTPGTLNWEEVVTGRYALPPWDVDRVLAHGGPIEELPPPGAPPPPAPEPEPDSRPEPGSELGSDPDPAPEPDGTP